MYLNAGGCRWRCCSWLEAEFNAFCIKFKKVVELAWNNQLILAEFHSHVSPSTLGDVRRSSFFVSFLIFLMAVQKC